MQIDLPSITTNLTVVVPSSMTPTRLRLESSEVILQSEKAHVIDVNGSALIQNTIMYNSTWVTVVDTPSADDH